MDKTEDNGNSNSNQESPRLPKVHSMKRRSYAHDYSRRGYYHITISVTRGLYQPLGRMAGHLDKPDGDSEAPHVELTPIGEMVEEELRGSIQREYSMLEVQEYIIMPEHLHFLLVAHSDIVSKKGKPTHLGHVIAGFKYGCNKRYWAITGIIDQAPKLAGALSTTVLCDSVAKPNNAHPRQQLPPLFEAGYCDVMPLNEDQLATQRAYILANPRSRLLRTANRSWLQPQRNTIDTAVTMRGLFRYLTTESSGTLRAKHCESSGTVTAEQWAILEHRLLLKDARIICDSYGSPELLRRRLLPVVCHRKDASLFAQQKARCLAEAAAGTVLVSARISKSEQEIMDSALHSGFPIILIEDNGFPEIYHPSANRIDHCTSEHLLLLSPWHYEFKSHNESISRIACKTMNCIAQAICKTRDDWWKTEEALTHC